MWKGSKRIGRDRGRAREMEDVVRTDEGRSRDEEGKEKRNREREEEEGKGTEERR